jgi:phosphate/sulfate permease
MSINSRHRVIMAVIGLTLAARLARDSRTQEHAIMVVLVLAAVAGLAKANRVSLFARLAAWDKRQTLSEHGVPKIRRA